MYAIPDYSLMILAFVLLPLSVASCTWLYDRFFTPENADLTARVGNIELLLHKEIADRTHVCAQLGSAVKQIVQFIQQGTANIRAQTSADNVEENANADSAAKEVRNDPPKNPTKASKIKNKRGGKKRGVPRGNVTPFPRSKVQKPKVSELQENE